VERIKTIQEESKAALKKVQEKMKRYTDRKRRKEEEYKVDNLVPLSTKDLKWQIEGRRSEKLTERFVGSYKVKRIILANAVELQLPTIVKIYPIVNVSKICVRQRS